MAKVNKIEHKSHFKKITLNFVTFIMLLLCQELLREWFLIISKNPV